MADVSAAQLSGRNTVVIVGAGIAGLAAAQTLQAAGRRCIVLEKSRAPFGRIATRTLGDHIFNYGAIEFDVNEVGFAEQLDWKGVDRAALVSAMQVGGAGLRAALAPLSAGLDLRANHQVRSIERSAGVALGFDVTTVCGVCLHAASVVLALPAPQVDALIAACTELGELRAWCAQVQYAPSCVVTVLAPCRLALQPAPRWRARNHVQKAWTGAAEAHRALRQWECVGDDALRLRAATDVEILGDLGCTTSDIDALREFHVKHWRYARLISKSPENSAYFQQNGVYLVGDFQHGTVASAYQSGRLAARNLLTG